MRFGISVPNFGRYSDLDLLRALAGEAEEAGWDGFFLWDHINWAPVPTLDPWIALAAIATSTSRIRIGPMITPLARRRPWVVARQAVTLDHLSGGRVVLGVGLGFPPDREFAALGEDAEDHVRGQKLDEGLAIIDGLWRGERFSFEGRHYQIKDATFQPKPVQQPRIPIWVAGVWPRRAPLRRAARWDGAFPIKGNDSDVAFISAEEAREISAYVRSHRGDAEPFDLVVGRELPADNAEARDAVAAFAAAGATWWMEGHPELGVLRRIIRRGPVAN